MTQQESDNARPVKTVDDSATEQVHLLFPRSLNGAGRLFGGQLLEWLDEIAGIVAMRHSGKNVVTASVERMEFKAGAKLGDTVFIKGYLTYVGTTSMEVRIDSYVEMMSDGTRHMINTAYFVMVAVDENEHPTMVPSLKVRTISEQAEWEAGRRRKEMRKNREMAGF